jgi:glycosyltransferase involved in cell wall biosynthesis
VTPPIVRNRIMTDLRVTQVPWWSQQLSVLAAPTMRGVLASVDVGWRTVRDARRFDAFICANVRNALVLALFKRVTFRSRPILVMTEMRLDDPRPGLAWRLKVGLQRFAFRAVDAMCVSARREAALYSERLHVPIERFRYIPWHTNVLEPRMHKATSVYAFAAGRTSRDWVTLAKAARGLSVPVTVVCSKRDADTVSFPDNVTVLTDIPYARYRALLEGAAAVLVPLEAHVYSSGQVVILEAMALGKPVITSRVLGTEDYIVDRVDGLLVPPGDANALREAITRVLTVPGVAEQLGQAALDKVLRTHTLDQYVRRIIAVADELAAGARTGSVGVVEVP